MNGTVLYDGECALCSSQVKFITDHDDAGRFRPVPLQSEEGRRMLLSAGMRDTDLDTVVYKKDDRYLTRSSAVLNILKDMGGAWKLLYGFIIIPAFIRDFFYRLVARNRHRFPARKR